MVKRRSAIAAATMAVFMGASAQSVTPSASLSTSTSIVTISDSSCASTDMVTDSVTVTITTCPACTEHPGAITQHTTVYTTTYLDLCPTGLTSKAYVVTETCTGETPTWSSATDYIPPGFTETVTVCTVCGHKPTPVTLTVPCDETPAPASGMSAAPAAPTAPTMDMKVPAAPAAPASPAGDSPGSAVSMAPAGCPGAPNCPAPYPTGSNSTMMTVGTSSPPAPTSAGSTPGGSTTPIEQSVNAGMVVAFSWERAALAMALATLGAAVLL